MGNGTSRVVGCFVPSNEKNGVDSEFLEPLDEGLGIPFATLGRASSSLLILLLITRRGSPLIQARLTPRLSVVLSETRSLMILLT